MLLPVSSRGQKSRKDKGRVGREVSEKEREKVCKASAK